MKNYNYIFLLSFFALISCNKDIDNSPPTIQIFSPSQNSIHQVFNSISVEILVEDDLKLEYVKFDVIDNNGSIAVNQVNRSGLSKKENLNVSLEITDIHLQSGNYFLRIVASDGINQKSEFVEIIIQEIPLKLERTFVFNELTYSMDSLSNEGNIHTLNLFDNNPIFAKTNSYYQETIIAFNNPSKLVFIKNDENNIPITFYLPNDQSANFYNNIHLDPISNHYYISTNTGNINEVGPNGSSFISIEVSENLKPNFLTTLNDLIFVEEKNADFSPNSLKSYYKNSGILASSHYLNFDLVLIAPINSNEIILIGNVIQAGIVAKYLVNENTIITLDDNLDQIYTASQLNSQNYALGFNQQISTIELSSNNIILSNSWQISSSDLAYDMVSNSINGVNSGNYFSINLTTNQLTTVGLSDYSAIELLYNK